MFIGDKISEINEPANPGSDSVSISIQKYKEELTTKLNDDV